jgi:histidinol-phosphate aminotransferase
LGASPKASAAYAALADQLHRYPDGGATALRECIGKIYKLDPARIVCGAGSDELLGLLVKAYVGPGDEVIYSQHGFLMYPILARLAGALPVAVPEVNLRTDPEGIIAAVSPRTKMIVLANPNNPTGSYLSADEIAFIQKNIPPHVLLILDAAYAEYMDAKDYEDGIELVNACENVIMTRTFSKIYGLAALRLGWCYSTPSIIDVLNRVRGPFNTSAAAIAAGCAAMEDQSFVVRSRAVNTEMRALLTERLGTMGLHIYPSGANFILVSFKPHDAEAARLFLKEHGVLVRQMGAYGLPDCLRITIGDREDVDAVSSGIESFLKARA